MAAHAPQENAPFLKQLTSSNSQARRDAISSLRQYLRTHGVFTHLEFMKLWKGLFYCMWMSDRPRAQQSLARDLAGLVNALREENVALWMDAFWRTIAREWNGIDALRMDKFLYLIRQYLSATFKHLAGRSWAEKDVTEHMAILEEVPLHPTNEKIPNGLRYHLLDIYVDEMERTMQETQQEIPLNALIKPLKRLKNETRVKTVRERAEETLEDDRLEHWDGAGANEVAGKSMREAHVESREHVSGEGEDNEEEWEGFAD